jgi:hypothetical protein
LKKGANKTEWPAPHPIPAARASVSAGKCPRRVESPRLTTVRRWKEEEEEGREGNEGREGRKNKRERRKRRTEEKDGRTIEKDGREGRKRARGDS